MLVYTLSPNVESMRYTTIWCPECRQAKLNRLATGNGKIKYLCQYCDNIFKLEIDET